MVAGKDNLIRVFGAQIRAAENIWTFALDWMDSPATRTTQSGTNETQTTTGGASASAGVPGIFTAGGSGSYTQASGSNAADILSRVRGGMAQVAREIGNSDYVLFVDDFHYMSRDLQAEVAKQLKAGPIPSSKLCRPSNGTRARILRISTWLNLTSYSVSGPRRSSKPSAER
jgi:hypothetical protein